MQASSAVFKTCRRCGRTLLIRAIQLEQGRSSRGRAAAAACRGRRWPAGRASAGQAGAPGLGAVDQRPAAHLCSCIAARGDGAAGFVQGQWGPGEGSSCAGSRGGGTRPQRRRPSHSPCAAHASAASSASSIQPASRIVAARQARLAGAETRVPTRARSNRLEGPRRCPAAAVPH